MYYSAVNSMKQLMRGRLQLQGCEVQEGEITLKVEANQELVAAMKKCDLTLTFEAGEYFSLNSYALFVGCTTIVESLTFKYNYQKTVCRLLSITFGE